MVRLERLIPSRPPTPPARDPEGDVDCRFRVNGTACEWGESYRPGGYHPVHLGDVVDGRYRIVRKLGYGAFSTVWLAVDLAVDGFVALKVSVASVQKGDLDRAGAVYNALSEADTPYIVGLRSFSEIVGPNGRHACFALDPMGPHLSFLLRRRPEFQRLDLPPWERRPRFPKQLAQRVLRDTLLGLRLLHGHGIVHTDLHPRNILANIRSLGEPLRDPSVEAKVRQLPDQGAPLLRRDGKTDLWAPSYLLEPAPLQDQVSFDLDPVVKITDLGAAFFEGSPPAKVVTPVALRAPETVLGGPLPLGKGIDIWAFGCLVFELLTGRPLFVRLEALDGIEELDEETDDEHLVQFYEVLGPLPAELASLWRRRDRYYDPDGVRLDNKGCSQGGEEGTGRAVASDGDDDDGGAPEDKGMSPGSPGSTSSQSQFSSNGNLGSFAPLEQQLRDDKSDDMEGEEVAEVSRLLRWILEHDALKRPSAEEILQHRWFRL